MGWLRFPVNSSDVGIRVKGGICDAASRVLVMILALKLR